MPQRTEQIQSFCRQCNKPTLHTRQVQTVNHVLHLFITLFCCGFWLPIWFLIGLLSIIERKPPFLCNACGQKAGEIPREQIEEMKALRRAEREARRRDKEERRAEKEALKSDPAYIADQERRRAESAETWAHRKEQAKAIAITTWHEVKLLPGRTDRALRFIAGKENDIIFWFLRIVTVLIVVGIFLGVVAVVASGVVGLLRSL